MTMSKQSMVVWRAKVLSNLESAFWVTTCPRPDDRFGSNCERLTTSKCFPDRLQHRTFLGSSGVQMALPDPSRADFFMALNLHAAIPASEKSRQSKCVRSGDLSLILQIHPAKFLHPLPRVHLRREDVALVIDGDVVERRELSDLAS